jgi:hypothetical protein
VSGSRLTLAEAALHYASRRLRVFPCKGKTPLTEHGCKDATADPETVRQMWEQHPDANVGVATGGRIAVLDIDGEPGVFNLAQLENEHGTIVTTTSKTWSGHHLWFKVPAGVEIGNSTGRVGGGLDVRGEGGYVLAPPSLHPAGVTYTWEVRVPLALMPEWLVELARKPDRARTNPTEAIRLLELGQHGSRYGLVALEGEAESVRHAPEGTRNHRLNVAAFQCGQLVGGGELARSVVEAELLAAALAAGLGRIEAERTIASGLNAGTAFPRGAVA